MTNRRSWERQPWKRQKWGSGDVSRSIHMNSGKKAREKDDKKPSLFKFSVSGSLYIVSCRNHTISSIWSSWVGGRKLDVGSKS